MVFIYVLNILITILDICGCGVSLLHKSIALQSRGTESEFLAFIHVTSMAKNVCNEYLFLRLHIYLSNNYSHLFK